MTTATQSNSRRTGVSAAAPAARTTKPQQSSRTFNIVAAVILGLFAILWLIPSLWAIKTSFSDNATAALGASAILKDTSPTLHSYATLLQSGDIWNWYVASAITSIVTVVLTVLFASMAAYALSRMKFRARGLVFILMLGGIMIPGAVLIVPIYQVLGAANLLNTYWAVIFPQVPAVIAVFVFKQFFDALPVEIEEAARIDGAGYWRIYRSIILPLSQPGIRAGSVAGRRPSACA